MSIYAATQRNHLLFGLPAKGRIGDDCRECFAAAGLTIGGQEERGYFGFVREAPRVKLAFLSAGEIVRALERGELHMGISGRDLFHELMETPPASASSASPLPESLALMENLGVSRADLRVAVPQGWIDAETMEDLNDIARAFHARNGRLLRVATKYPRLTREIFCEHELDMYRIVASLGATEGAPRAGLAEVVADISSTGATLRSNGLKPLVDVCWPSEAQLAASRHAPWHEESMTAARFLLERLERSRAEAPAQEGIAWWQGFCVALGVDAAAAGEG